MTRRLVWSIDDETYVYDTKEEAIISLWDWESYGLSDPYELVGCALSEGTLQMIEGHQFMPNANDMEDAAYCRLADMVGEVADDFEFYPEAKKELQDFLDEWTKKHYSVIKDLYEVVDIQPAWVSHSDIEKLVMDGQLVVRERE
ncbi:hypothetical protein QE320_gp012 [Pseudomonas phage EM]|uniref:Uncharacterized protein n=1 Tax=Pseudomonas phage EM TaxID=2936914 RepID=A0AAE9HFT4_9CAUD|nr:hypothetical protein QE320_gp012 [Pseudomonas phage EM]UPW35814.1 hypothetical protein EM_012 [Pseudomonas phage EM]